MVFARRLGHSQMYDVNMLSSNKKTFKSNDNHNIHLRRSRHMFAGILILLKSLYQACEYHNYLCILDANLLYQVCESNS